MSLVLILIFYLSKLVSIPKFLLELKETVARMGADLKQKVLDSVRSTWNSVYQMAMFHRSNESLTEEMNQVRYTTFLKFLDNLED